MVIVELMKYFGGYRDLMDAPDSFVRDVITILDAQAAAARNKEEAARADALLAAPDPSVPL